MHAHLKQTTLASVASVDDQLLDEAAPEFGPSAPRALRVLVAQTRLLLGAMSYSAPEFAGRYCTNRQCRRLCVSISENRDLASKLALPWEPFQCVDRSTRLYWAECAQVGSAARSRGFACCSTSCYKLLAAEVQRLLPFEERVVDYCYPFHKQVDTDVDVLADAVLARNAAARHALKSGVNERPFHLSHQQVDSFRCTLTRALNVDALLVNAAAIAVAAGRQSPVTAMVGGQSWRCELRFRDTQGVCLGMLRAAMRETGQNMILSSRMGSAFERFAFEQLRHRAIRGTI